MQDRIISVTSLSLRIRLLIAFVLGLLLGTTAFMSASDVLLQWVPLLALLIAMMLSVAFDARVLEERTSTSRIVYGFLLTFIIMAAVYVVVGFLLGIIPLAPLLIAFELGMGVAFAVGNEERGVSSLSGLVAWFGTAILLVISAAIQARAPGSDNGALFSLIVIIAVIGLGVAALGGMPGCFLRTWVMKRVVKSPLPPE
jgi:hypothetical protein